MGDTGSTLWYTSTAPVYASSKYTFTISNLSGRTGLDVEVNDIIFYSTYYYIVSAVNTSTVDCTTRVSIKGSDASVTIQTAWGSTLSDSKVPSEKLVKNSLPTKTSDLTNDGSDGINAFVPSNDSRLSDVRNPKNNTVSATSTDRKDLDDYVDVGFYNFFNDSTIPYVDNKPSEVTHSFFLIVEARSTGAQAKQTLSDYYTGKTYVRTKNTTWGSWSLQGGGGSSVDIATSWGGTLSDTKVPSEKLTKNSLDDKISKSSTAGLVKNDGTIDTNAYITSSSLPTIQTSWGSTTSDSKVPSEKLVKDNLDKVHSHYYGTCSTAAGTQVKEVTSTDFVLATGVLLSVKFTNANSYNGTAQLKINNATAVDIATVGTTKTSRYHWTAGEVVTFVYDGTNFVMDSEGTATTTYYGITKLSSSTSSTSESVAATPKAVKAAYDLAAGKLSSTDVGAAALSNSYADLDNKPTIPSKISDLTNDSGFITSSAISGMLTSSDIVDNLTTDNASKVLSAKQGKALNDLIGNAISYINQ